MKRAVWKLSILLAILLISCEAENRENSKDKAAPVVVNASADSLIKSEGHVSDTIYSTETVIIIGDTLSQESRIDYAAVKFEPYIGFSDFKVRNIFTGKAAPIDYNSNPTAKEYRTRITETYKKEGVNFAGHYNFVWWGCGSICKSSAIVDVRTGKVYDGPTSELGYRLKENSWMLIVNPPDSTGFYDDCLYCHPFIYIWNEQSKKFEERLPVYE